VNGVFRCLNMSNEGERCDLDSKNVVCDPILICDERSLTCRRAILEEDCLYRQCVDGLVCLEHSTRSSNVDSWTYGNPSKLNEPCFESRAICEPGLEYNNNICWPLRASGSCSGGFHCPLDQECKATTDRCGPYPRRGEDCPQGL
jgi:hypothetical protein